MQTDAALVEKTKINDPDAFGELYERHHEKIIRVCQRILKNPSAAEDAAQETFLRAYSKIDSFQGTAQFSTWLQTIARNESFGKLRNRSCREISSEGIDFMPQFGKCDRTLELSPEWRELVAAIKKLSLKHQQILYLRVMGYPYKEIATTLGRNIACCKSRYNRAVICLRRVLARPVVFRARTTP
jgi:RNA polymerase sigma-70 factor (ECF subfamily)